MDNNATKDILQRSHSTNGTDALNDMPSPPTKLRSAPLAKTESSITAESDLLRLLPEEVRPLVKLCIPFLVQIVELGASRALSRRESGDNGTNLIDVKDTAVRLQVSPSHVRNLIAQGELQRVDLGRSVRIEKSSLEAFIERNKHRDFRANKREAVYSDGMKSITPPPVHEMGAATHKSRIKVQQ